MSHVRYRRAVIDRNLAIGLAVGLAAGLIAGMLTSATAVASFIALSADELERRGLQAQATAQRTRAVDLDEDILQ